MSSDMDRTFRNSAFRRSWTEYHDRKRIELENVLETMSSHEAQMDVEMMVVSGSFGLFGLGGGLLSFTDPLYAVDLVGHTLTGAYMLNGTDRADSPIVEIGYGKKLNDAHMPLLSELGYDITGIELGEDAVERARDAGYKAELVQDLVGTGEEIRRLDARTVISCRTMELCPLMMGIKSDVQDVGDLFLQIGMLGSGSYDGSGHLTEREAYETAQDFFRQVRSPDSPRLHVHTTSDPFVADVGFLQEAGYDVVAYNEHTENIGARHLTVFKG